MYCYDLITSCVLLFSVQKCMRARVYTHPPLNLLLIYSQELKCAGDRANYTSHNDYIAPTRVCVCVCGLCMRV